MEQRDGVHWKFYFVQVPRTQLEGKWVGKETVMVEDSCTRFLVFVHVVVISLELGFHKIHKQLQLMWGVVYVAYFISEETCTIKIWRSLIGYGHFLVWSEDVMNCGSVIWILKSNRWLGQTAKCHYNYEHMSINQLQDYDLCVQGLLYWCSWHRNLLSFWSLRRVLIRLCVMR